MKRVADKFLGGEFGLIPVAPCETIAANKQLARDSDGHRLEMAVENVKFRIGNRPADDDGVRAGFNLCGGRPDSRLGGAVKVPQLGAAFQQLVGHFSRQGFAAGKNPG